MSTTSRFPEEALDLPAHEQGGYYPAQINGSLDNGRYKIIRKLGYGPRSSTWLILEPVEEEYFAVKIYTLAASAHANTVELPILKRATHDFGVESLSLNKHFWEETNNGSHLCLLSNPSSITIHSLLRQIGDRRLPVHVVQKVVSTVAAALTRLHKANIMHGGIKLENILLSAKPRAYDLEYFLQEEASPVTVKVKKYTTVRSQPLPHDLIFEGKKDNVVDRQMYLSGYGHAQESPHKPEKGHDYYCAPETAMYRGFCSPKTDIWMLGCMAFHLLTGYPPFYPGAVPRNIAYMAAVLKDDTTAMQWRWYYYDTRMTGLPEARTELADRGAAYVPTIEASLREVLEEDEVEGATSFIKACLRLKPDNRISAKDAWSHPWLSRANTCMCGYYCKRETCGRH